MLHTVVYIVEAKQQLVEWLRNSEPGFLECLRGPFVWTAKEDGYSPADERLAKFKVLYFLWLVWSYPNLLQRLPSVSKVSLNTFDEFWSVRRIEVEGDLADLRSGADKYNFGAILPTGNPAIDAWVWEMKEKTQVFQPSDSQGEVASP